MIEKILFGILLSNSFYYCIQSVTFSKSTTEYFVISYLEDRRIVPVRIELNTEQKTEHVRSSRGGETLYDFNQGKVAYKDTDSSQCFIADITEESLEEDRKRLRSLRNGIIRKFYLPTFVIQEEFLNGTHLSKKFGVLLTQFCEGNTISSVARLRNRRKRDTSGDKGQFTHHTYGHYGHQSNNYAHYGHETYVTGSVDKDGQMRTQGISQQQVRSGGSQGFPGQSVRSGPSAYTSDSTTGISSPQSQTQYQMPNYQRTLNGRDFGTGGSGQFAMQTAQESGYQLNLPLGLKAGNAYSSGIRSAGQYGVGGLQPQISTEFQKFPSSIPSSTIRSGDQTSLGQISPPVSSVPGIAYPSTTSDRTGIDALRDQTLRQKTTFPGAGSETLPFLTQTGISPPITTGERRIDQPSLIRGTETSAIPTDSRTFLPDVHQQHGVDKFGYDSQGRKYVDQTSHLPDGHKIPMGTHHPGLQTTSLHTGARTSETGIQTPVFQPGISMPSRHVPGFGSQTYFDSTKKTLDGIQAPGIRTSEPGIQSPAFHTEVPLMHRIERPSDLPRQILPGIDASGTRTSGTQHDLSAQKQYKPSSMIPMQQLGQVPASTYPSGYKFGGDTGTRTQVPILYPPSTIPGQVYPRSDKPEFGQVAQPFSIIPGTQTVVPGTVSRLDQTRNGVQYPDSSYQQQPFSTIPGAQTVIPGTVSSLDQTRNGIQYPDSSYQQSQRGIRGQYPGEYIPQISAIPGDGRSIPLTSVQPGDRQLLPRGTGLTPDSSRGYQIPPASRQGGTLPQTFGGDSRLLPGGATTRLLGPGDRTSIIDPTGRVGVRLNGQDSAASQTQIQTDVERTAAEASAAGSYRGLGSQTQVQGGYSGNGSFSAQAQSGFTGGVVQSQVQGSKSGGLSGSSAQVERVGSAQSQVQVGQPSGAASSSAQGRFSGGTTQVQAQSGKSGGSAGAQAQSVGLSSSHVQVNIGGNDIRDKERFQGTVSASVQGGYSSGQSQTQMQGGYESGRTYVATAQGGFDTSQGFEGAVPPVGSLTGLSSTASQRPLQALDGRPVTGSTLRIPTGIDFSENQTSQTTKLGSRDQATDRTTYTQPSSVLPDQRQQQIGRIPQQFPSGVVPLQTSFPSSSGVQESRIHYPTSEDQRPSHVLPSSQTARYPYPVYPSDTGSIPTSGVAERQAPISSDFSGHRRYDQSGTITSGLPGSQQTSTSGVPSYQIKILQPSVHSPGIDQSKLQESALYVPSSKQHVSRDSSYPSSVTSTSHVPVGMVPQQPISSLFPQPPPSPTFGSTYIPSYPPSLTPQLQRPSLPTDQLLHPANYPPSSTSQFQRPSLSTDQMIGLGPSTLPALQREQYPHLQRPFFPGQPQIFLPGPETIPSFQRPVDTPVLTKPDSIHPVLQPGIYPVPSSLGQSQIQPERTQQRPFFPGQPQISPPGPETIPSYQRPVDTPVPTRPDSIHSALQPGIYPIPPSIGQSQIQPEQTQISTVPKVGAPGMLTPTETTTVTHTKRPGVPEPDTSNCCEALRDLKRRCCNGVSKNNGASSCCSSVSPDDMFDFSSEDKLDETKEGPCKIVKAICYIVYKPVGKARICKPTQTNGC